MSCGCFRKLRIDWIHVRRPINMVFSLFPIALYTIICQRHAKRILRIFNILQTKISPYTMLKTPIHTKYVYTARKISCMDITSAMKCRRWPDAALFAYVRMTLFAWLWSYNEEAKTNEQSMLTTYCKVVWFSGTNMFWVCLQALRLPTKMKN